MRKYVFLIVLLVLQSGCTVIDYSDHQGVKQPEATIPGTVYPIFEGNTGSWFKDNKVEDVFKTRSIRSVDSPDIADYQLRFIAKGDIVENPSKMNRFLSTVTLLIIPGIIGDRHYDLSLFVYDAEGEVIWKGSRKYETTTYMQLFLIPLIPFTAYDHFKKVSLWTDGYDELIEEAIRDGVFSNQISEI